MHLSFSDTAQFLCFVIPGLTEHVFGEDGASAISTRPPLRKPVTALICGFRIFTMIICTCQPSSKSLNALPQIQCPCQCIDEFLICEDPFNGLASRQLRPLYERYPVSLSDGCEVTRYPTTGIDNMLVVRIGGLTILNLNDCNLPAGRFVHLIRKIGHIDILLANYNHAGKLLEYPSHEQIKETFKKLFQVVVAAINPTWVIPFASLHYYRSHASAYQNGSFLTAEELSAARPPI